MRNAMLTLKTTLKTATSGTVGSILKPALFAVLMWTASAAGAVPIPGTPVPITLQTFVVMLAALMLPWKQAGAAMLMYLAKPYLKENAQILDPCCGVGTMLIERDILVPAREKYGIDIFGDMARENAALAGEKINFIHRDYFDFKHDYKFDEIVTNMPVKGKKAKEDMDAFYARFFEKSKSLLAEDGIIIMYSNEVGFVKKQLRLQPCYRLIQEYTIRKKDSYCLFIIGMK